MVKKLDPETDELNLTRAEIEFCAALVLGMTKKNVAFRNAFPDQAGNMSAADIKCAADKLAKDPRIIAGIELAEDEVAKELWEGLRARGLEIPEFRGFPRGPDTLKLRSAHRIRARPK